MVVSYSRVLGLDCLSAGFFGTSAKDVSMCDQTAAHPFAKSREGMGHPGFLLLSLTIIGHYLFSLR